MRFLKINFILDPGIPFESALIFFAWIVSIIAIIARLTPPEVTVKSVSVARKLTMRIGSWRLWCHVLLCFVASFLVVFFVVPEN